jgi:hypothetical protein
MDADWHDEMLSRAAMRDEVERILRKRCEGVNIDAIHAKHRQPKQTFTACAGPCDQGRKLCPCPDACEAAADERNARPLHQYAAEWLDAPPGIVIALALVGAIVAVVGVLHWMLT